MRSTLIFASLLTLFAVGCDNPQTKQHEADQAQREAEKSKIEEQARADEKQREATLALERGKFDYRARLTELLSDIDKRTSELQAKNKTATDKEKASNNDRISALSAKRNVLVSDVKDIDEATAETWNDVSKRVDADIRDARASMLPIIGKT